jgi:4-amino-4-deoxy-L-arabinose transferase-like glycosyltransferase
MTQRISRVIDKISSSKGSNFLILVFTISLILRLLFIFIHEDFKLLNEMGGYVYAAKNFLAGNGLLFSHERDYRAFLPPLYSVFLAVMFRIFGENYFIVRVVQSIFSAICAVLTYCLGKKMYNDKVARFAAIIMAVYPQNIVYSDLILTEVLFLVLFLSGFLLLVKCLERKSYSQAVMSGILLGLASLTRSISFYYIFFVLFCFIVFRNSRFKTRFIVIVALVTTMTISPWTIRNYILRHAFIPINTKSNIDLYMYNHSGFYNILTNTPNIEDEKRMDAMGTDEVTLSKNASMLTREWIKAHPFLFLFKGIRMMWNFASLDRTFFVHLKGGYYGSLSTFTKIFITPYIIIPFMLLMPLTVIGFIYIPKYNYGVKLSVYFIAYLMILGFISNIFYRQRYPLLPIFSIFASYAILHIKDIIPEFISFPKQSSCGSQLEQTRLPHFSYKSLTSRAKLSLFLITFFVFGWVLDIFLSLNTILQNLF